jgi:Arc/MetJ-type ribon-helix-helix transcriptional regulator
VIDLKPDQQRMIDMAVKSGVYRDPSEVLEQAFEIIREQLDHESWMLEQREAIAAHIENSFKQAERGDLLDGDTLLDTLRTRRSQLLKTQG